MGDASDFDAWCEDHRQLVKECQGEIMTDITYPSMCPGCEGEVETRPGEWQCNNHDCEYFGKWRIDDDLAVFERDQLGKAANTEVTRKDKRADQFDMALFLEANIEGLLVPLSKHAVGTHAPDELVQYDHLESKIMGLIAAEFDRPTCVFELVSMLLHVATRYLKKTEKES